MFKIPFVVTFMGQAMSFKVLLLLILVNSERLHFISLQFKLLADMCCYLAED